MGTFTTPWWILLLSPIENNKEIRIPTKLDSPNILAIGKIKEVEDLRKLGSETEMNPTEKQTHYKILSTNDKNLIESIDSRHKSHMI